MIKKNINIFKYSNSQQFYQYQQSQQSPLNTIEHKKITTYSVGNPGSDLGQTQN